MRVFEDFIKKQIEILRKSTKEVARVNSLGIIDGDIINSFDCPVDEVAINLLKEIRDIGGDEEETIYNFIQIQLTGIPDYKDCIKNIIREYVSQEEEFDLINSYNKVQITGEKNSEDVKKYTDYINLLNEIKTNVKRDFNI